VAPGLRPHLRSEDHYARERDCCACSTGQARGEGAVDTGWRIRSRRNPSCPRRETRRALHETGDCDRTVEGAAGWREDAPTSGERKGHDQAQRGEREPGGEQTWQDIVAPCARGSPRAQTRRSSCSIAKGAVASGQNGSATTAGVSASRCGTKGCPNPTTSNLRVGRGRERANAPRVCRPQATSRYGISWILHFPGARLPP
jgi:hypothetical protein